MAEVVCRRGHPAVPLRRQTGRRLTSSKGSGSSASSRASSTSASRLTDLDSSRFGASQNRFRPQKTTMGCYNN